MPRNAAHSSVLGDASREELSVECWSAFGGWGGRRTKLNRGELASSLPWNGLALSRPPFVDHWVIPARWRALVCTSARWGRWPEAGAVFVDWKER